MTGQPVGDDVLREQMAYYRARAPEYDQWFLRQGRYDRGAAASERWNEELNEVRAALDALPLDDADLLELASGTGIWTNRLARRAAAVTAVDASAEMVTLARQRLGTASERVRFVQADLFSWVPDRAYDGVVFCFWISHVPEERLDAFLERVADSIRSGGFCFFLDGRRDPTSTAGDHVLPALGQQLMLRRLDDGREYQIVKNYWLADELEQRAREVGLDLRVHQTATFFQYGVGHRRT